MDKRFNKLIEWYEPHPIEGATCRVQMLALDAILHQKKTYFSDLTDEKLLEDFMTTHWASFVEES